jgi:hypothetical protein
MDPIKIALFMSHLRRMHYYRQKRRIQYPLHRYVAPIEYPCFEFDLNSWADENIRRNMR